MPTTRRDFLKTSAAATVTLLVPAVVRGEPAKSAKTLVILQLAGGNDALNTLVPYTDPRYRALRPTLAVAEGDLLPGPDRFGLHPSLGRLAPLFRDGRLALVAGVGFPSIDRSHFRSQDVWQTGDEGCGRDYRPRLGWIGRYADYYLSNAGSPLVTVAIGNKAPLGMAVHQRRATVIAELSRFALPPGAANDDLTAVLRNVYSIGHRDDALSEAIRAIGDDLFRAVEAKETTPMRPSAVTYPDSRLGAALRTVASIIDARPETHAAWVTSSGYDTHAKQGGEHAALLSDLAASLSAFQADLARRGLEDRVLLMAWSEFGRRAAENASAGTDHGKGGIVFIMGAHVRGDLWGEPPDLGRLVDGDLPPHVDFRSVYATLIRRWFGHDPEPILGRVYPTLGFLG